MLIKVPVCFSSYIDNIYEDRKTCIFCVLSLVKPKKCPEIVLKFSKNWVLKFHFLLLGALQMTDYYQTTRKMETHNAATVCNDYED